MNASELATKMLEWEQAKRGLDALTAEIEAAVLEVGQTQTVGNVRATYSGGRTSYDYQAAGVNAPAGVVADYTKTVTTTTTDWKTICDVEHIADIPFTQSAPSVTVKLLK